MTALPSTLEIDRRQRLAAAQLLMAVDLPQEATAFASHMIDAAKLCPGVTLDELVIGNRREALEAAQLLLDEMMMELLERADRIERPLTGLETQALP